jgi:two-component system chemotaxis response regulator CheB
MVANLGVTLIREIVVKINVLVIDDSALVRNLLTEIINENNDMIVVATAPDPLVARELIKLHNPDVLTLDVEMPKMDGLDFLERLMRLRPMPVVMVSTLTEHGSNITLRALELGAIDFITKPKLSISDGIMEYADLIADKIRIAAQAKISRPQTFAVNSILKSSIQKLAEGQSHAPLSTSEKLIIIGASTGGTVAITSFLSEMPPNCPGILITQHMPVGFTKSFANRLDSLCQISVKEAEDGERILPGHAYIAPGDKHLLVTKSGAYYLVQLEDSPPVNRHKPSVDVLFSSVAKCVGKNATGVILTGMGKDGAVGMLQMKEAGSYNLAQDEASCVVYGMPKEAVARGGVDHVASLKDLPKLVLSMCAK